MHKCIKMKCLRRYRRNSKDIGRDWEPVHGAKKLYATTFVVISRQKSLASLLNPLEFFVGGRVLANKLKTRKIKSLDTQKRELIKIQDILNSEYLLRTVNSVMPRFEAYINAKVPNFEFFVQILQFRLFLTYLSNKSFLTQFLYTPFLTCVNNQ